jgi:hypothetical protein
VVGVIPDVTVDPPAGVPPDVTPAPTCMIVLIVSHASIFSLLQSIQSLLASNAASRACINCAGRAGCTCYMQCYPMTVSIVLVISNAPSHMTVLFVLCGASPSVATVLSVAHATLIVIVAYATSIVRMMVGMIVMDRILSLCGRLI